MKYRTEWLFAGFIMFWFISITAIINNHPIRNQDILLFLPFLIWGICSLLDYIKYKYG